MIAEKRGVERDIQQILWDLRDFVPNLEIYEVIHSARTRFSQR